MEVQQLSNSLVLLMIHQSEIAIKTKRTDSIQQYKMEILFSLRSEVRGGWQPTPILGGSREIRHVFACLRQSKNGSVLT